MAENKKSFIAYCDWLQVFEELEDDEAGRLVKHLFRYVNDFNPETDDKLTKMCFIPIKQSLKRDLVKYEQIRQKRSLAGKASANKRQQVLTSVESVEQTSTNPTVSVNDSVSVNEEYIYSKFYDFELTKSDNNEHYKMLIEFIHGKNSLKKELKGVLSIRDQLTYEQFKKIMPKCKDANIKVGEILTGIENDKKYYKGKLSLYRTMLTWTNRK